jgi:hypothetical protein
MAPKITRDKGGTDMPISVFRWLAAAALTAALTPSPAVAQTPLIACFLAGEATLTGVSGEDAATQTLHVAGSAGHGLTRILNRENQGRQDTNRPCWTDVTLGRFHGVDGDAATTQVSADCQGTRLGDDILVGDVIQDRPAYNVFISAINVCTSNQSRSLQRRLKGIQVRLSEIDLESCTVSGFDPPPPERGEPSGRPRRESEVWNLSDFILDGERNRCNGNWRGWRACAEGQIATGLVVHNRDRGVSGLQLECRDVTRLRPFGRDLLDRRPPGSR